MIPLKSSQLSMLKNLDISKRTETISKILHAHPNVAIALLDRAITCSEHTHSDSEFHICYDFHILDPGPRAGQPRFTTLKSLVKDRQEKILSHPLVTKMLYHKWNKFGRNIYVVGLLTFMFFHFCLCWAAMSERHRYHATFHPNTSTYIDDASSHNERNITILFLMIFMAIIFIVKEIIQIFLRGLRYSN